MQHRGTTTVFSALFAISLAACGGGRDGHAVSDELPGNVETHEDAFTSHLATLLDFEFDGELVTSYVTASSAPQRIEQQLLYTIGNLNSDRSVGRLDRLQLSNIRISPLADGTYQVAYRARLPVAWGSKTNLPTTYTFALPRLTTTSGLEAFTAKYMSSCVDSSAHDVDAGSMWYYYRPRASGCALADGDVVRITAQVTKSPQNTIGKFPEYHKVWEDNRLHVVAIFGKNEDGATTSNDAGIAAYNSFIASVRSQLAAHGVATVPANLVTNPGISAPDVELSAQLPDGKRVVVNALLVDNVRTAGAAFDHRYEQLSPSADVIAYNGHAGLGANVRALARKGQFVRGKYLIVLMNGCDTFAYVDGALAETRAAINPDDPAGTKYMEIITNAMPAYFSSNPRSSMALMRALMNHQQPLTYERIFAAFDSAQVVVVTGEEDNVFTPGMHVPAAILKETSGVTQGAQVSFQTATLPVGTYSVRMTHDPARPGGDADLYVGLGAPPTTSQYTCRPYKGGSNEECRISVTAPTAIFVMVRGYAAGTSAFVVEITKTGGTQGGWPGIDESFTLVRNAEKRWQTPVLQPGTYVFETSGTGDVDLYTRKGAAPSTTAYDCRPFRSGSSERCTLTLTEPAVVHVMVVGYATTSSARLVGKASP